MIPICTSTIDHMNDSDTIQEKSPYSVFVSVDVRLFNLESAADSR